MTKDKRGKLDFTKIKKLSIRGHYQEVKRHPTEWEKIIFK